MYHVIRKASMYIALALIAVSGAWSDAYANCHESTAGATQQVAALEDASQDTDARWAQAPAQGQAPQAAHTGAVVNAGGLEVATQGMDAQEPQAAKLAATGDADLAPEATSGAAIAKATKADAVSEEADTDEAIAEVGEMSHHTASAAEAQVARWAR
jgi:basic membrane lipoprotein Med (substrate-binding protein (PBP1-ABC) superfamily)